jgi:hypothetical protein
LSQSEQTTKQILEKKAKELPLFTRTSNMNIRFCEKCKCIKPDRAHHCGVCQTCVLKVFLFKLFEALKANISNFVSN